MINRFVFPFVISAAITWWKCCSIVPFRCWMNITLHELSYCCWCWCWQRDDVNMFSIEWVKFILKQALVGENAVLNEIYQIMSVKSVVTTGAFFVIKNRSKRRKNPKRTHISHPRNGKHAAHRHRKWIEVKPHLFDNNNSISGDETLLMTRCHGMRCWFFSSSFLFSRCVRHTVEGEPEKIEMRKCSHNLVQRITWQGDGKKMVWLAWKMSAKKIINFVYALAMCSGRAPVQRSA